MGRRAIRRGALLLATAVAIAGCSSPGTPGPAPTPGPETQSHPSTPPVTSPSRSPQPPPRQPLTIAVAGDVHFEGVLRSRLDDPSTALAPATTALAGADVAIVNLETSVGTGGDPEPGKRYPFQAPPSAFTALAAAGVDVATMANNHALDFGRAPLAGTFRAIATAAQADPPLHVVGLGRDAEAAFAPARIEVDGVEVAVIGATLAADDPTADPTGHWAATDVRAGTADAVDPARLLAAVADAAAEADVVVAYLHWGIQGERCPTDKQQSLARELVDAGADVVAGTHAHRLQGDGRLRPDDPAYVAYGLGNYAWYSQGSEVSSTTGVLTLTVRPAAEPGGRARVTAAQWEPARIGTDGLPSPLRRSDRAALADFEAERADLRTCAGLSR
ncbi:CapA family protein [Nocardioides sp. GXZ039]|uniref:CapA family protein n=1 Tax=Nocardioides sp. GXZ039 TaxID=3136018 RepID=UPI0030F4B365